MTEAQLAARVARLEGVICWAVRNLQRIRDAAQSSGAYKHVITGCLDHIEGELVIVVPAAAAESDRCLDPSEGT